MRCEPLVDPDCVRLVICPCGWVVRRAFSAWVQWAPKIVCDCAPEAIERRAWARRVRVFAHGVSLAVRPGRGLRRLYVRRAE